MKITLSLIVLLASQISFAASTLKCGFHSVKDNEISTVYKSQVLVTGESLVIDNVQTYSDFASLDYEDESNGYQVKVTASIYEGEKKINSEAVDLKNGSMSRSRGEDKVYGELFRSSEESSTPVKGVAFICSIVE